MPYGVGFISRKNSGYFFKNNPDSRIGFFLGMDSGSDVNFFLIFSSILIAEVRRGHLG